MSIFLLCNKYFHAFGTILSFVIFFFWLYFLSLIFHLSVISHFVSFLYNCLSFHVKVSCLLCLLWKSSLIKILSCVSGVYFVVFSCSALQLSHRYFSHPPMLSFSPSSVLFSSFSHESLYIFIVCFLVFCFVIYDLLLV